MHLNKTEVPPVFLRISTFFDFPIDGQQRVQRVSTHNKTAVQRKCSTNGSFRKLDPTPQSLWLGIVGRAGLQIIDLNNKLYDGLAV